ncbi:MAG: ferrous iron transport protein B [Verrucomicrobiota bacterium]|nr:ferrous iron transport protein B [Verrucomicrobiota bacterium]
MKKSEHIFNIAVAGNPNAGKTCIFNALTGGNQCVGNYPGVTVELVEGNAKYADDKIKVVDLPGTYSLTAYSKEELVARDYIMNNKPDVIVDVVDAGNLERNLYLTVQLLELKVPVVIALNMVDIAEKKGYVVDPKELEELLGVKVISTIGNRKKGIDELKEACDQSCHGQYKPKKFSYSHELSEHIRALEKTIAKFPKFSEKVPYSWSALKLLERDKKILLKAEKYPEILKTLEKAAEILKTHSGEDTNTAVAEGRHGIAKGASMKAVRMTGAAKKMLTDRIDAVVCNRFAGPLFFLLIVYSLFKSVFFLADEGKWIPLLHNGTWVSPMELMDIFFIFLGDLSEQFISWDILLSLVKDGIIGGVGGVLSFVPLIFFMFFFISILEDTGYIARIAFILDRLLRIFGLQGKSALAMIVSGGLGGGGCAVPGVLATRTMREEKDRFVTIMVVPMMNCGAKLPVYAMVIAAFFPHSRGKMMFLLWGLSWVFALTAAFFIRKFICKGEQTPFVMELPVYHIPTFKGVMMHTLNRTWMYIKKAGTIILAISILFWVMMYFPRADTSNIKSSSEKAKISLQSSFAGRIGNSLVPISQFAGLDWQDNIALLGGFAAKEVVIGTLSTAYSLGGEDIENSGKLAKQLRNSSSWSGVKAFAFMIFVMLYAPCFPTIAAIKKETGSWKWAAFSTAYSTVFAFVVAVGIYQIGNLIF